jgi:hypothetical protein
MNKLLTLSAAALLGTASFATAQETLTNDSYFTLPQVQENDGTIDLGTVTVGADCNDQDVRCAIEVYEVTDNAMTNNLAEETLLHGGANTNTEVTLRSQPQVGVIAVLKINEVPAANVYIPFSDARSDDSEG